MALTELVYMPNLNESDFSQLWDHVDRYLEILGERYSAVDLDSQAGRCLSVPASQVKADLSVVNSLLNRTRNPYLKTKIRGYVNMIKRAQTRVKKAKGGTAQTSEPEDMFRKPDVLEAVIAEVEAADRVVDLSDYRVIQGGVETPVPEKTIEPTLSSIDDAVKADQGIVSEAALQQEISTVLEPIVEPTVEPVVEEPQNDLVSSLLVQAKPPSNKDVVNYFKSLGVTGEETNACLLVYAMLQGTHTGIVSLSGSGKTVLYRAILSLQEKDDVLEIQGATKASIPNDPKLRAGAYKQIAIQELQKSKELIEVVKSWAEGEPYVHSRTKGSRKGVERLVTPAPNQVLYTFAISNEFSKKVDEELTRRFVKVYTDISPEQTERVLEEYAASQVEEQGDKDSSVAFKKHIEEAKSLGDVKFVNPFMASFVKALPDDIKKNVRTRSFIKYISELMAGSARYHFRERAISRDEQGNLTIHVALPDLYNVQQTYGSMFYDNVRGVDVIDNVVLQAFDQKDVYTEEDLLASVQGLPAKDKRRFVQDSIKNLTAIGLLKEDAGTYKVAEDKQTEIALDWNAIYEEASEIMRENHSVAFEAWNASNTTKVYDITRGESIQLVAQDVSLDVK